jgi:hypothetical protein
MDHFALLPAGERATIFREVAARSRVSSATIIEKDFWVCSCRPWKVRFRL